MDTQCHEVLDSLHTEASKRVYRFIHFFRPTLASFKPFLAHFRVPRVNHKTI
jgi:hypothetical protein